MASGTCHVPNLANHSLVCQANLSKNRKLKPILQVLLLLTTLQEFGARPVAIASSNILDTVAQSTRSGSTRLGTWCSPQVETQLRTSGKQTWLVYGFFKALKLISGAFLGHSSFGTRVWWSRLRWQDWTPHPKNSTVWAERSQQRSHCCRLAVWRRSSHYSQLGQNCLPLWC